MEIGLLKAFQHIEVVALNVQVLCGVEVHTLLRAWAQRGVDGGIGSKDSLALVGPSKLVALFVAFYNIGRQQLAQLVEVNGTFYPPPRPSENVTLRLIIVDRATIATSPEPI